VRSSATALIGCLAALALAAGCGQYAPSPGDTAQNYETALAEGNYKGACGYLDPSAKAALSHRLGSRATCPEAMARCLPYQATIPQKDQSQLLFATILVSEHRSHASATLNGTAVANAIRQVSLLRKGAGWILTSYGRGFTACHQRRVKHRRAGSRA